MTDAEIAQILRDAVPGLLAVYRFGSSVAGTARPDSDVDVAVLAAEPIDAVTRFEIQEDLGRRLGRDVDLIDLRQASTVMRMQVLSGGRLLASYDTAAQEAFEDHTYSAYARLNEERREILAQIRHEGRVHGR